MENQNPVSAVRVSRRGLMKAGVAASAAKIAGIPITVVAANEAAAAEQGIKWTKGVCRFCGTGCGLLVGTKNGKIVATKGDPDCEVNRGLTCMKGYYNSEIIYGKDRLTQPLMRRTNGKFDKNGKFEPVSWKEAFDELEKHWRKAYQELGPTGVGIFGSGQYTIPEGVAVVKLLKAGFRSNNIDPNARLCMASAVVGMYQTFGVDEPSACYHDLEITQNLVLWGNNPAEAHPVLWNRIVAAKRANRPTRRSPPVLLTSISSSSRTRTSRSRTTFFAKSCTAAATTRTSSRSTASSRPVRTTSVTACVRPRSLPIRLSVIPRRSR